MRVVLDTNVLVSRFLSPHGAPAQIFALWRRESFEVLVSAPILAEYAHTLAYPHLRALHGLGPEDIAQVITDLGTVATLIPVTGTLAAVPADPDDDKFVECAIRGGADYVVSGDAHLLRLREYQGIRMVSPALFLAILQQGP